ncbi:MAG: hypothetical protein GXO71_01070 [Caldiserica bacterium]|nr:hypothetical protein [Caldisericota bacterium]
MGKKEAFKKIEISLRGLGFDNELIEKLRGCMDRFYDERIGDYKISDYKEFSRLLLPLFTSSRTVENILKSTEILEKEEFSDLWIKEYEMRELLGEIGRFFASLVFQTGGDEEKVRDFLFTNKYPEEKKRFSRILKEYFKKLFTTQRESKIRETVIKFANLSSQEDREKARYLLLSFFLFSTQDNVFLKYLFIKSLIVNMGLKEEIMKQASSQEEGVSFIRLLEDRIFSIMEGG